MSQNKPAVNPPLWLLAELTYCYPLQCPYCSNPLDFARREKKLTTEQWIKVFRQARAMGSVQLNLSGGEPLTRKDLPEPIRTTHDLGSYTNLVTSGIGLTKSKLGAFSETGLDHIQISFQANDKVLSAALAGNKETSQQRLTMARAVKARDYPMILNFILHWHNIGQLDKIIELCIELETDDVELTTCQFYGRAFLNREGLLPTREQIVRAEQVIADYRQKTVASGNLINLLFVTPDYYEGHPKGCMGGRGLIFLSVTPGGTALPCHSMRQLPVAFPSVLEQSLESIWHDSFGFSHYCGYGWMSKPCRSCDEKEKSFGDCHCQAFILTGSADSADPVCNKSPHHHKILEARREAACSDIRVNQLQFRNHTRSQLTYKTQEL